MLGGAESSRDYVIAAVDCAGGFVQLIPDVAGKQLHITRCSAIVYGVAAAGIATITESSAVRNILFFATDVLNDYAMPNLMRGISLTPGEGATITKPVAASIFVIIEGFYTLVS